MHTIWLFNIILPIAFQKVKSTLIYLGHVIITSNFCGETTYFYLY